MCWGGSQNLHNPTVMVKTENVGVPGLVGVGWQRQLRRCAGQHQVPGPERRPDPSLCVCAQGFLLHISSHPPPQH